MPVYSIDRTPDVPDGLTQRQAAALTRRSRPTIKAKIAAGILTLIHGRISRASAELLAGRQFTRAEFDQAVADIRRGRIA
jgi:hypothetical protein